MLATATASPSNRRCWCKHCAESLAVLDGRTSSSCAAVASTHLVKLINGTEHTGASLNMCHGICVCCLQLCSSCGVRARCHNCFDNLSCEPASTLAVGAYMRRALFSAQTAALRAVVAPSAAAQRPAQLQSSSISSIPSTANYISCLGKGIHYRPYVCLRKCTSTQALCKLTTKIM
jgi:hypothetical protein